jgi:hypothetical protein
MNDLPIINLLPEQYRGWATLAILSFPYITRMYYALATGSGLVGGVRAILWGTNQPKQTTEGKNENNP